MNPANAFRLLAGLTGGALVLMGLALVASFFGYQQPGSTPGIPTGPVGHYFIAFAGCASIGWGGALLGAARDPRANRTIATSTAFALVLMSVVRMMAWLVGDYYVMMGEIPRVEAGLFLLLALGFIWLRPAAEASQNRAFSQGGS